MNEFFSNDLEKHIFQGNFISFTGIVLSLQGIAISSIGFDTK